ncbi:LexA family transcriptional regulator [Aeromonas veronii]
MTYKKNSPEEEFVQEQSFLNGKKNRFADRLEALIGDSSTNAFAKKCGLTESTLRNYLTGNSSPNLATMEKIAAGAECSLGWLASGIGPKELGEMWTWHKALQKQDRNTSELDHLAKVPTFDVEAAAGAGAWINAENIRDYWYVPRAWLRLERLEHAELCIINTVGDSMTPYINHGDRLLVKTNIDREKALEGVFVINLDGHLRVKRLEFTLSPIGYRVISDNEMYPPEFVPAAELTQRLYVIGEVVRVFGQPAKPTPPIQ